MVLYLFLISTLCALLRLTIMSIRACSSVPARKRNRKCDGLNIYTLCSNKPSHKMNEVTVSPTPLIAFLSNSQSASASNGETATMVP